MGAGSYNVSLSMARRASPDGYSFKSREEIFSHELHKDLDPKGVIIREARDSEEHPNSIPTIIGLDVTGSMGDIPEDIIKHGLNNIMASLQKNKVMDPQILFMAIGDHECDYAPLQVGQFESNDELLDMWLEKIWLEGHGGGNAGESYLLAWYFAAYHTKIDCVKKRNKKGYLFTIGDEPTLKNLPATAIKQIMGAGQHDYKVLDLYAEASKYYHIFHIHVNHGYGRERAIDEWKQLIGDHLLVIDDYTKIAKMIADKIVEIEKTTTTTKEVIDVNIKVEAL